MKIRIGTVDGVEHIGDVEAVTISKAIAAYHAEAKITLDIGVSVDGVKRLRTFLHPNVVFIEVYVP